MLIPGVTSLKFSHMLYLEVKLSLNAFLLPGMLNQGESVENT